MEYRMAVINDAKRLAEMRWSFKDEETPFDITTKESFVSTCTEFLQKALQNNWFCWVAVENNIIVSHVFIEKVDKIPEPNKLIGCWGYITNVYTAPEWRNQKIGTQLTERVKEWCKSQGFELLLVWPSDRSIPFYGRAGFKSKNEVMELLF